MIIKQNRETFGLGYAISYYMSKGYVVLLPINDTQPYDLCVDKNDNKGIQKVSIKTCRFKRNQYFNVSIDNTGGSSGKTRIKIFNKDTADILFVYTISNEAWEIPTNIITKKHEITLNKNFIDYKIL